MLTAVFAGVVRLQEIPRVVAQLKSAGTFRDVVLVSALAGSKTSVLEQEITPPSRVAMLKVINSFFIFIWFWCFCLQN